MPKIEIIEQLRRPKIYSFIVPIVGKPNNFNVYEYQYPSSDYPDLRTYEEFMKETKRDLDSKDVKNPKREECDDGFHLVALFRKQDTLFRYTLVYTLDLKEAELNGRMLIDWEFDF